MWKYLTMSLRVTDEEASHIAWLMARKKHGGEGAWRTESVAAVRQRGNISSLVHALPWDTAILHRGHSHAVALTLLLAFLFGDNFSPDWKQWERSIRVTLEHFYPSSSSVKKMCVWLRWNDSSTVERLFFFLGWSIFGPRPKKIKKLNNTVYTLKTIRLTITQFFFPGVK